MIAPEIDIDHCQFHEWFPLLHHLSIKSEIVDVDDSFISYLRQDGLVIPQQLDENDATINDQSQRSLLQLKRELSQCINSLGGEVFVKMNWSAPIDALWMNCNSAKCHSSDDIFCLLKSSDRIIFDLENMYNLCPERSKQSPTKCIIVVRKWANLTPSMEFRLFIYKNKLSG
jgi:hypothetical protein